jgi:hypothetical protein
VPTDALVASELVLPAEGTSLDQVRALPGGEGLIPGDRRAHQLPAHIQSMPPWLLTPLWWPPIPGRSACG